MLGKGILRINCRRDVGHSYVVDASFKISLRHATVTNGMKASYALA